MHGTRAIGRPGTATAFGTVTTQIRADGRHAHPPRVRARARHARNRRSVSAAASAASANGPKRHSVVPRTAYHHPSAAARGGSTSNW